MGRERADRLLVDRGFFESRSAARAAIEAGGVKADGTAVRKPSEQVCTTARLEATRAHPFVSRGGLKLSHALATFEIEAAGRTCLDIGSSTGGFSDVLLKAGAAHVIAVDVGRGQFHPSLRNHPRITLYEATDARDLTAEHLPSVPDLLVADASFISLAKLLGRPLSLAARPADLVALFKPQFEVGRIHIGKGGRVRANAPVDEAAEALARWLAGEGWPVRAWTPSPVPGGDGNLERLLHARRN